MNTDQAQLLAQQAFLFLSEDDEKLTNFLSATGIDAADLRQILGNPEQISAFLDFLVTSDDLVLEFAQYSQIDPRNVLRAQAVLAGPGTFNWTAD